MARNKDLTAKDVFDLYMVKLDPTFGFSMIFEMFFGGSKKEANFQGGCGDTRTLHERIFALLYPRFKQQVVFGTGKDGYEKYGVKRYIADFYDEKKKRIYEIDGDTHKREIIVLKDKIRDYFFYHELGITTVRFTNKEVEKMLYDRLLEIESEGRLNELVTGHQQNQSA